MHYVSCGVMQGGEGGGGGGLVGDLTAAHAIAKILWNFVSASKSSSSREQRERERERESESDLESCSETRAEKDYERGREQLYFLCNGWEHYVPYRCL